LDLAHGELAPELAATVREHVRGCVSCGAALSKLEGGLAMSSEMTWLEPPRALRVNAMALAERHLQERTQMAAQGRANARPRASFVQAVFDFIGRMAAGRQVAMATIMMLIVAVGLWSLPQLQQLPPGQGVTVVSPDPDGEAAPSGGLAPAEPLDLAVDARSRRIRSREELAAASNAYAKEMPVEVATAEEQVAVAMAAEPPPPPEEKAERDDDPLGQLGSVEDVIAPSAGEKAARAAGAGSSREQPVAVRNSKSKSSAFPDNAAQLAAVEAEGKGKAEAPMPAAPAAAPKPASAADLAEQSADREQNLDGASVLSQAQSARGKKGCLGALAYYQEAAKVAETQATALIELAECQRELGRIAAARATLERAVALPQVATRARSMLEALPSEPAKPTRKVEPASVPAASQPAGAP
jgi:hypothetical protein